MQKGHGMIYKVRAIKKLNSDPDGRFSRAMDDYAETDFYNVEAENESEAAEKVIKLIQEQDMEFCPDDGLRADMVIHFEFK